MTNISTDDVLRLAALSSLQLSDQEIEGLRSDIERILGYVEQLDELDTEGVEPAYQVTGLKNVYRSDDVENDSIPRDKLLSLSHEQLAKQIKVPKVL
jgi:aspartyl-tRNA(Asn)/glutamyl-tRNA(Gln) amidotransferase subunit C